MNNLKGKITSIKSHENLSIVKIGIGEYSFTTVVIETPETVDYLKIDNEIRVLFKETEVLICLKPCPKISLQNRIECKIHKISEGKLLSQINMQSSIGDISSIITTNAVDQLKLNVNDEVIAMIKTNEIMLQHD